MPGQPSGVSVYLFAHVWHLNLLSYVRLPLNATTSLMHPTPAKLA